MGIAGILILASLLVLSQGKAEKVWVKTVNSNFHSRNFNHGENGPTVLHMRTIYSEEDRKMLCGMQRMVKCRDRWLQREVNFAKFASKNRINKSTYITVGNPRDFWKASTRKKSPASRLKRGTDTIRLKLEENVRISPNAPLYKLVTDRHGKQTIVKKDSQPITAVKLYQDREHAGSFTVRCDEGQPGRFCRYQLRGNFYIDGENYDIYPSPSESRRNFRTSWLSSAPHLLVKQDTKAQLEQFLRASGGQDGLRIPQKQFLGFMLRQEGNTNIEDGLPIPPDSLDADIDLVQQWKQRVLKTKQRQANGKTRYTVECFVVTDPPLWEQHYEEVLRTRPRDPDQATEQRIREYFSHILNGVDLRYMSIEDPEMEIYITLSGFLILQDRGEDNPYPASRVIVGRDGTEYAEAYEFIDNVQSWANSRISRRNNDHVFVFSGYTLIDGSTNSTSVIGLAFVGGVCSSFRTSINQEHGYNYWLMTSLAAHELGHNLGANHDNGQSRGCSSSDRFVMAPSVSSSLNPSQYRINPFRFSVCSIRDFKDLFTSLSNNCLLDDGDFFNETAYNIHASNLPGQIYSIQEQCQLLQGTESNPCSRATDEGICSRLWCSHTDGFCYAFAAAPGTPCGRTDSGQWCHEGLCQIRPSNEEPSTIPPTTIPDRRTTINEITTQNPTTTQTSPPTAETLPPTTALPTTTEFVTTTETSTTTQHITTTTTTTTEFPTTTTTTEFPTTTTEFPTTTTTELPTTTTVVTTTSTVDPNCVDNGFWGYGCDVMQLWYRTFDQFCRRTRRYYCCATCRDRNIAIKQESTWVQVS